MERTIAVTNDTDDCRYEARKDGNFAGFAAYDINDGVIDFNHTKVLDEFTGFGIGTQLIEAALLDVRERGEYKVKATCPFVINYIRENPGFEEILAEPLPDAE